MNNEESKVIMVVGTSRRGRDNKIKRY